MKTRNAISIILNFTLVALFVAAGLTSILLKTIAEDYDGIILGTILLVAGIVKFISYFVRKGFKHPTNLNLISGIAMVAMAIIFFIDVIDIPMLCFGWGIMEIVLSLIEIQIGIYEVRKDKLALLEIAIALGSIVFGVLLCIKLSGGLGGHLIYLGISLILMAALILVQTIISIKHKGKE